MRLNKAQIQSIQQIVREVAGKRARVFLFGSRLLDERKGGDVDLLVDLSGPVEHPAVLAARLSARISRALHGRRVDIVLKAPNLKHLPIHEVALREGYRL
ncbi:MAG: nucleotidyltransferase domain-containing protein [Methylohalobius sp. ZOD2]